MPGDDQPLDGIMIIPLAKWQTGWVVVGVEVLCWSCPVSGGACGYTESLLYQTFVRDPKKDYATVL